MDPTEIHPETYVIRDLQAESIDLLEIGVAMQYRLNIAVDDDQLFLKDIRLLVSRAENQGCPSLDTLQEKYPHLAQDRLQDILHDLPGGPVVQVQDLIAYAKFAPKVCT